MNYSNKSVQPLIEIKNDYLEIINSTLRVEGSHTSNTRRLVKEVSKINLIIKKKQS